MVVIMVVVGRGESGGWLREVGGWTGWVAEERRSWGGRGGGGGGRGRWRIWRPPKIDP